MSCRYQWVRVDGTTETDVGTNSSQYMPVAADVGKRIKVRVSFTDQVGFDETLESASVPIRGMNMTACAANTPGAGRTEVWPATLTVGESKRPGNIAFAYGYIGASRLGDTAGSLSDTSFDIDSNGYTIQNLAEDESGTNGQLLLNLNAGLTSTERTHLRLHVRGETYHLGEATNDGPGLHAWPNAGIDWSPLVGSTRAVALSTVPHAAPTGRVAILGVAQQDQTLTASTDYFRDANGLDDAEFTYQWVYVDIQWNRALAGVAVSVSEGKGTFEQPGEDSGKIRIESRMTAVSPYARYMVIRGSDPAEGFSMTASAPLTDGGSLAHA